MLMLCFNDKIWCLVTCSFRLIGRFCLTLSTNEESIILLSTNKSLIGLKWLVRWSLVRWSVVPNIRNVIRLHIVRVAGMRTNVAFDFFFFRLTVAVFTTIPVIRRKYKKSHSINTRQMDWLEERRSKTSQVLY